MTQGALLCGCGSAEDVDAAGFCPHCRRAARHDVQMFSGLRLERIQRDGSACVACGSPDAAPRLVVHHRKPGRNALEWLATLCRGCHLKVHLLPRPSFALIENNPVLYRLWREANPDVPVQIRFEFAVSAPAPVQLALVARADIAA